MLSTIPSTDPATQQAKPLTTMGLCLWLVIATVLGGALRLYKLDRWSFWEDELFSISTVTDDGLAEDTDPPTAENTRRFATQWSKWLGYVPIEIGLRWSGADVDGASARRPHEWQAHGINEWRARIGPCIIGIASIPILAWASIRLIGTRGAAIVALLLAVSPWHLFWSQASRFYTLQFLFYNLALVMYFSATTDRSRQRYLVAMLMVVLAYMAQPPALLIGLVFAGDYVLGWLRRKPIPLGVFEWLVGLGALTLCLTMHFRDAVVAATNWEKWASLEGHGPLILFLGTIWENNIVIVGVAMLAAMGLARSQPRLVPYLVMGAVLPVLAIITLAATGTYAHTRYGFPMHFSWLLLAALGLTATYDMVRPRFNAVLAGMSVAALLAALLLVDLTYLTAGYGQRRRWAEAFTYIQSRKNPGDQIASERTLIAQYYLQSAEVAEFPRSPKALHEIDQPTWLILPAVSATRGEMYPWLNDHATFKAYFDVRVVQPYSSVRVYYYDPAAARPNRDVN